MASRNISLGFTASMPVSIKAPQEELDKLLGALGSEGWHEIRGDDGTMRLNISSVLWVRAEEEEHHVGFGAVGP
jgi:hypothetical protein